ncbi:MAG TPA: class I SAM-dependent methyltransferase [Usitatibacter sp.]|nr:class I SAM-dependent methyltransferase [Usitatibacter sp.]
MPDTDAPALPAWQSCLDIEEQSADHYHDYWNQPLLALVRDAPRHALELGCAGGMFGAKLKERFPQARVTGIEAGRAAAQLAAQRLDRVIVSRLEDIDFAREGFQPGELDLVIAADILEHLANPWQFLVRLRPFVNAGGRVLASIPNARNLNVILDLVLNGRFRYAERGLLDVTHLRFFALADMRRLFEETGYVIEGYDGILSPSLAALWKQSQGRPLVQLRKERFSLEAITQAELAELCTEQFLLSVRVA